MAGGSYQRRPGGYSPAGVRGSVRFYGTRPAWSACRAGSSSPTATPTHDYLSIAVEFENGIDITYHWSAELPFGMGYRCPLPTWKDRELHVVVRTGTGELGRWLDEERKPCEDYRRYVGEPPGRIVPRMKVASFMAVAAQSVKRKSSTRAPGTRALSVERRT